MAARLRARARQLAAADLARSAGRDGRDALIRAIQDVLDERDDGAPPVTASDLRVASNPGQYAQLRGGELQLATAWAAAGTLVRCNRFSPRAHGGSAYFPHPTDVDPTRSRPTIVALYEEVDYWMQDHNPKLREELQQSFVSEYDGFSAAVARRAGQQAPAETPAVAEVRSRAGSPVSLLVSKGPLHLTPHKRGTWHRPPDDGPRTPPGRPS